MMTNIPAEFGTLSDRELLARVRVAAADEQRATSRLVALLAEVDGFLEYHHVVPFASGGKTSESNLELRCRAHNQYEADQWFGATREWPMVREVRACYARESDAPRIEASVIP